MMVEIRLLAFAAMMLLVYWLRLGQWWRPEWRAKSSRFHDISLLIILAATMLLMWLFWKATGWAIFLDTGFFTVIPVDAAVAGLAVGYILADQQLGAEQAVRSEAERLLQQPENLDAATKYSILGHMKLLPKALANLQNAVPTLILTALAVLAVVPPTFWFRMFDRVNNFKAAGVELTLGPVAGDKVTQEIRSAAPPRNPLGGSGTNNRHGFSQARIERMETLTHPATFRSQPGVQASASAPLWVNPTAYLFTQIQNGTPERSSAGVPGLARIRDVDRDRAVLLHLQLGSEALDTRNAPPAQGLRPATSSVAMSVRNLGATQASLLALLKPHVACLRQFIEDTGDRRLLEYRTRRVAEELYLFAQLWTSIEHAEVLRLVGPGTSQDRGIDAEARAWLLRHGGRLSDTLDHLIQWTHDFRHRLVLLRKPVPVPFLPPGPVTDPPSSVQIAANASTGSSAEIRPAESDMPLPASCQASGANHAIFTAIRALLGNQGPEPGATRLDSFGSHGFTPYLVTFVAQALSALDDHAAALRLLTDWYEDLNRLIQAAEKGEPNAIPGSADTRSLLRLAAPWYHLSIFIDIIQLQTLSENSDLALPRTEEGLRHLVMTLFPDVLDKIKQNRMLPDWQDGKQCRAPSHSWRQPLVLSYATWVKDYLDLRNAKLIRPSAVTQSDLDFAEMLGKLNLECFRDELRNSWDQDQQRADFALTEIQIRMNELVLDSVDPRRRDELGLILEQKVNRTIDALAGRVAIIKQESLLDRIVFGRNEAVISALESARSLKAHLETLRRRL